MYPYRIHIKEPNLQKIMNRLAKDKHIIITGKKSDLHKLSYKLKPIRQDIFIGFDMKTHDSSISLKNPFLRIEKEKNFFIFKI